MSTAAVTPEVVVGAPASTTPVTLTPAAINKVREIMATQTPVPAGLRIGVVGGGCSGFQYSMSFENQSGMMDKVYKFDGPKGVCGRDLGDVPAELHGGLRRDARSRRVQI